MKRIVLAVVMLLLLSCALPAQTSQPAYKQVTKYTLGGEGGWDYVTFDPDGKRLFIAHTNVITVVDATNGNKLGELPAQGCEIWRFARRDAHHDHTRHRQLVEREPAAEPRLQQPPRLFLTVGPHATYSRRGRCQRYGLLHLGLDVAIG